jgi:hypothetical protein
MAPIPIIEEHGMIMMEIPHIDHILGGVNNDLLQLKVAFEDWFNRQKRILGQNRHC